MASLVSALPTPTRKAADGSIYDPNAMTAAHRELPMGSIVRVTNLTNNESVIVRITDRGPFVDGRIIDLSLAAAKAVDIYRAGYGEGAGGGVCAAAPGSDPAGKWCVQIGAFLDEADAIQLKNDLMRRYATAKVIEFAGPTGPLGADQSEEPGQGDREPDCGQHPHSRPWRAAVSGSAELAAMDSLLVLARSGRSSAGGP